MYCATYSHSALRQTLFGFHSACTATLYALASFVQRPDNEDAVIFAIAGPRSKRHAASPCRVHFHPEASSGREHCAAAPHVTDLRAVHAAPHASVQQLYKQTTQQAPSRLQQRTRLIQQRSSARAVPITAAQRRRHAAAEATRKWISTALPRSTHRACVRRSAQNAQSAPRPTRRGMQVIKAAHGHSQHRTSERSILQPRCLEVTYTGSPDAQVGSKAATEPQPLADATNIGTPKCAANAEQSRPQNAQSEGSGGSHSRTKALASTHRASVSAQIADASCTRVSAKLTPASPESACATLPARAGTPASAHHARDSNTAKAAMGTPPLSASPEPRLRSPVVSVVSSDLGDDPNAGPAEVSTAFASDDDQVAELPTAGCRGNAVLPGNHLIVPSPGAVSSEPAERDARAAEKEQPEPAATRVRGDGEATGRHHGQGPVAAPPPSKCKANEQRVPAALQRMPQPGLKRARLISPGTDVHAGDYAAVRQHSRCIVAEEHMQSKRARPGRSAKAKAVVALAACPSKRRYRRAVSASDAARAHASCAVPPPPAAAATAPGGRVAHAPAAAAATRLLDVGDYEVLGRGVPGLERASTEAVQARRQQWESSLAAAQRASARLHGEPVWQHGAYFALPQQEGELLQCMSCVSAMLRSYPLRCCSCCLSGIAGNAEPYDFVLCADRWCLIHPETYQLFALRRKVKPTIALAPANTPLPFQGVPLAGSGSRDNVATPVCVLMNLDTA
jgi:hypothetical protein